ncbi:30 kDa heat shock protein [Lachnellula suecica]|uniref:30 kDa heat shock protein n=1 Tax=Lachnellula suecica TaxID=602035 RepID=A0A8T9CF80_9HELO|nr:30 kDa heat shock protein [Lachnellula suecica]
MSLWPRSSYSNYISEPSFTPLFRLLDEFDTYNSGSRRNGNSTTTLKSFQPKFDVKEVEAAYELHGELPGIDQKDVEIEFVDPQTLSIRGRTERSYERGTRPTGHIEGPASSQGAITEGAESNSHKATVEDADDANESGAPAAGSQVAKQQQEKPQEEAQPASKYWVAERSIGEFSRTFSFPSRVDQDAVKASMQDGILSIVVPKAKKVEGRRKIAIN